MKIREGRAIGSMMAVSILLLGGCGGSSSNDGMGVLNLSISDSPIKDAAKVCVKFDGVQLKKADTEPPFDIDFADPVVINLLANQGAVSETLVSTEVEAGNYQWIRLKVDAVRGNNAGTGDPTPTDPTCNDTENGSYLVTDGGSVFNLWVPSGDQTGLKLIKDITVPANRSGNYTAEWDLGMSFVGPPGLGTGEAIMKPVVKLVANNEVGTLNGTVADGLISPNPADPAICDAENGFGPTIYVFDDNGVGDDPVNGDDGTIEPVATGLVGQDMQGMPYSYEIGFLLAGNYEVAFTCNGENFIPANGKGATITEGGFEEIHFTAEDLPST